MNTDTLVISIGTLGVLISLLVYLRPFFFRFRDRKRAGWKLLNDMTERVSLLEGELDDADKEWAAHFSFSGMFHSGAKDQLILKVEAKRNTLRGLQPSLNRIRSKLDTWWGKKLEEVLIELDKTGLIVCSVEKFVSNLQADLDLRRAELRRSRDT